MKKLILLGVIFAMLVSKGFAEEELYQRLTVLTPISPATQVVENESGQEFSEIVAGENPGEEFLKAQLPLEDQ